MTKIAGLMVKKHVGELKKKFDPAEHGGAPLLGFKKPVIKAHGNSNAKAFASAIRQAHSFASSGVTEEIADAALLIREKRMAEGGEESSD
jgi:glycerol-3-phosphate acyltransferase PlsX